MPRITTSSTNGTYPPVADPAKPAEDRQKEMPAEDRFKFINSTALDTGDYRPQWPIYDVLVKDQPGIIAGPSKTLKTNVSIDFAVSLASGTPFLGEFRLPNRIRTDPQRLGGRGDLRETSSRTRCCRARV
jgi:hypothetical protein